MVFRKIVCDHLSKPTSFYTVHINNWINLSYALVDVSIVFLLYCLFLYITAHVFMLTFNGTKTQGIEKNLFPICCWTGLLSCYFLNLSSSNLLQQANVLTIHVEIKITSLLTTASLVVGVGYKDFVLLVSLWWKFL